MKRLIKKSNHMNGYVSTEIEDKITHPDVNLNEDKSSAFLLVKQLFADTAFNFDSNVGYQFARKIENGEYNEISEISDAKEHWEEWLNALKEFISKKNGEYSKLAIKKKASQNNFYGDKYTDNLYTDNYLDREKDVKKENGQVKTPSDREKLVSDSFVAAKDIIYSLPIVPRYDLMSQLAQDIERGDFDDLGPFESNRDAWLQRAKSILRARNIIIS